VSLVFCLIFEEIFAVAFLGLLSLLFRRQAIKYLAFLEILVLIFFTTKLAHSQKL
jgi:hypothetical protein